MDNFLIAILMFCEHHQNKLFSRANDYIFIVQNQRKKGGKKRNQDLKNS